MKRAYAVACAAHAGDVQDSDGSPYVQHPIGVARLLCEAGYDEEILAAALLHDVLERSELTVGEIGESFGARVAELVAALTEPTPLEGSEDPKAVLRRQVVAVGPDAEAIFAADKVDKTSNVRRISADVGVETVADRLERPLDDKLRHYEATLDLLEHASREPPLLDRLRDELDALQGMRRGAEAYELARIAADAITRLDPEPLVEVCQPDVEWWPALTLGTGGGPYRGHDGIRRYVKDVAQAWDELVTVVHEHRHEGNRLMVICDIRGRGRVTRRPLDQQSAVVYWLDENRIACAKTYLDAGDVPVSAFGGPTRRSGASSLLTSAVALLLPS